MCVKRLQRKTGLFNSILKATLAASIFASGAHAQPVVYDMKVVDETSFEAFKSAIIMSAYVSSDYMFDPNPRVVASVTATMVFVSNNPFATSQEINDFLTTYSNALAGFDGDDPDLQRSSSFFAAIRGLNQGSALFAHIGFDLRVGNRVLEALDIEVPAPLDFVTTQSRMVKFENARLRSFKSSPDWSMILTLALYGQDLDGNANGSISTIVENYLVSEGFHPLPANTNIQPYLSTRTGMLGLISMTYNNYLFRQNEIDPMNIGGSSTQQFIDVQFQTMQTNADNLITQIVQGMTNPPTVIEAAQNTTNPSFLQQQIDIYHQDLYTDIRAQSSVGWSSMILLQSQHNEAQQYSTAARDFAHVRLQTDDTLAKTKLGIQVASGLAVTVAAAAEGSPSGAIGGATDAILASLDLADAFGAFNSPPPPEEQIFNQIVAVREDIDAMRVQMHDRFDRVEDSLNLIYINMNQNFGLIGNQIGDLQISVESIDRDIAVNHAALERIETALYGMFQDSMWLDLAQKVDLVLNYRNAFGVDLSYSGSTSYINSESALLSWTVTGASNTVYAGPTTSLLQSFDDAQGVLTGSSIGRNVNDLRVFPQTLGLPMLLNSRVVASAPWTQGASVYTQLAHESPWYFAYMYNTQTNNPGAADLDSIIAKGDNLLAMMENGRSAGLFTALLDGYSQAIDALNIREAQVIAQNSVNGINIFSGLHQTAAQSWLPHFGSLDGIGASNDNLELLPGGNQNWSIFNGYAASPEGKNIAPASALLVANAASAFGVIPSMQYQWFMEPIPGGKYFLVFDFIADGNGGVSSRGLRAQTRRLVIMDIYENNGQDHLNWFSAREAEEYLSQDLVLWRNFRPFLHNGQSLAGQSIQVANGNGNDSTFVISSDYYRDMPNDGRLISLGLLEDLQVATWQALEIDNTIITQTDRLGDWATLLEAYATLSMPDLIAESTVAASALRGKAFGPVSVNNPAIIDYRDSLSLGVDMQKFYELNAIDPANYLFADARLRPSLNALSDSIDLWINKPFPGHGYINYMLAELNDLRNFVYKLAIDDHYTTSNKLVVSAANGLLANDFNQQFRQIEVASYTQPSGGSVIVNPDGSFVFNLNDLNIQSTSFTYTSQAVITNGGGIHVSNTATVILVVIDPNTETFVEVPSAQFPTISLAIEAIISDPNSVIELAPGTYNELINTQGKAFTLRSASGNPEDTIISGLGLVDSEGYQRVITIRSDEGRDTVIEGVTICEGNGFMIYPYAGGGMLITDAEPTIRNCIFADIRAFAHGGSIAISGTKTPLIVNSQFFRNESKAGGAIGTFQNFLDTVPETGNAIIVNCTFSRNRDFDGNGGAVFFDPLSTNSVVENSVLWWNIPNEIGANGVVVRHSIVKGGLPVGVIDGGGNLSDNPMLISANTGNLRITAGSPAIDAGSNTPPELVGILTDLDGNPRFIDDLDTADTGVGPAPIIDMGAYEFQYIAPPCAADLTGDGFLNFFDISAFLMAFNNMDPIADFSGDGLFNFFDISSFLQAFTAGCP